MIALDSEGRDVRDTVANALSYTSVIAVPVFVVVAVLGGPLVRTVYGGEYVAALPFVVCLAGYRIVQVQREALDSAMKGLDRPDQVFRSTAVAVTLNFAVGVPLLYAYGPAGVAVATVLAELAQWGVLHRALSRERHAVPMVPPALRKQFASGLLMGAVLVAGVAVAPRPGDPSTLVGLTVAGSIVYAAGVVAIDATVNRLFRSLLADLQANVSEGVSP